MAAFASYLQERRRLREGEGMEYKESRGEGREGGREGEREGDTNRPRPPSRRLVSPQETKDAILLSSPLFPSAACACLIFERGKSRTGRAISAIERGCADSVIRPTSSAHSDRYRLKHYMYPHTPEGIIQLDGLYRWDLHFVDMVDRIHLQNVRRKNSATNCGISEKICKKNPAIDMKAYWCRMHKISYLTLR